MIEKKTTNRNYPKPDANNFLQDDVGNIESALDLIDQDIHDLKQEQTAQNNLIATKADQAGVESTVNEINNTKADKSDVENKFEETKLSIAQTKLAIEGKLAMESFIEFSI